MAIRDIVRMPHRVGFLAADDRTFEQEHVVLVVPFVACDPVRDDEVVVEHELAEIGQVIMLPILCAGGEFLYSYRVLCSTNKQSVTLAMMRFAVASPDFNSSK